jgi:hypothetical protein
MGQADATVPDAVKVALDWACAQSGWWHDAGNLNPAVLAAIVAHAARIGARETAETGCGLSTVVLSAIADCHTCFTVGAGNSLALVQAVPHLRQNNVNFVIGPSQLTLPRHSFARPLDLVLIDGPHGFPFAQIEYFHFYQRLRKGGMLVVDDIHIPTIRQMYDFLRDDRMWTHVEDVLTTAFFQRTDAPLFDPHGDGWETQQFNQRHFPDKAMLDTYCSGWRERMPPAPGLLLGADAAPLCGHAPTFAPAGDDTFRTTIEQLRAENAAMKSSTSWRITAPLRALSIMFRRG